MVNDIGKTRKDKIEDLQLKLIEIERKISTPTPEDPFTFMTTGRRKLEHERDTIRKQISFLLDEQGKEVKAQSPRGKKSRQTKQESIHKKIEAMQKRRPNATKTELFEALAEQMRLETSDRVKKAYYDFEAKLKRERDTKARNKRDSGGKSTEENRG